MTRVRLIHWNAAEALERAARIEELGYRVESPEADPNSFRQMKSDPPDAVVIDLSRLPSHGRDVAVWLRQTQATRTLPVVFVEGAKEKIERIKQTLPDGIFATYRNLGTKLAKALKSPRKAPIVPKDNLSGYSGTPLAKKLGIKPQMTVHLLGAPDGFIELLHDLPPGVGFKNQLRGKLELVIWFLTAAAELEKRIDPLAQRMNEGSGLWIAWPKKSSGVETDVTQDLVRKTGLAAGLVDYKICAIDETWSGLKFAPRRS